MINQKTYAIILRKEDRAEVFLNDNDFFILEDAIKFISFFEDLYPANKGYYKIIEVRENKTKWK